MAVIPDNDARLCSRVSRCNELQEESNAYPLEASVDYTSAMHINQPLGSVLELQQSSIMNDKHREGLNEMTDKLQPIRVWVSPQKLLDVPVVCPL